MCGGPYRHCISRSPSGSCSLCLPGHRRLHCSCSRHACSGRTGTGCFSGGAVSTNRGYSDSYLASLTLTGTSSKRKYMYTVECYMDPLDGPIMAKKCQEQMSQTGNTFLISLCDDMQD